MEIDIKSLKAVSLAASRDGTRPYLNGVNLQLRDGAATLVATNGHILMGVQFASFDEPCNVIIPLSLINKIKINKKIIIAQVTVINSKIMIKYDGIVYGCHAIDAEFASWKCVVPRTISGIPSQLNPKYLSVFTSAAKIMGSTYSNITVGHNGHSPCVVDWYPDALGIIMPLRNDKIPTCPVWSLNND